MEFLLKLNGYTRLAIILCISLLIHLAIIYGVSWSPVGSKHATHPIKALDAQHRLTVTLTLPSHATAPQQPESAAIEKTAAIEVADVANEAKTVADNMLSSTDKVLSTALATRYFTVAELDQHPAITQDIPDNPPELLGHSQGGEIVLRLWIDETGKVVKVDTISSNLPQAFIDSAHASFLQAVFSPGRKLGDAVASVMDVVVSYAPTTPISQMMP